MQLSCKGNRGPELIWTPHAALCEQSDIVMVCDGDIWVTMSDDEWRLSFCEVKSSLAAYPGLRKTPGLGCKTS